MLRQTLSLLLLMTLFYSCQQNSSTKEVITKNNIESDAFSIGQKISIPSEILNEDRQIIISLPEGYSKSNANYPVLYLTDGFQNIEHVRGAVEILTRTGNIPPMIIVGIKSIDRERDFTPTPIKSNPKSGGSKAFLTFIETELIPYIDSNYRTHPFRILEGHSLGGLFAANTLLEKPNLFDAYIIMSPSLWWNQQEILKKASPFFKSNPDLEKSVFFGIGKKESSQESGMRKELSNFIEVLKADQPKKLSFEHKEFEDEGYMSSPLLSNYYGLKFIFSDLKYSDTFKANYSNAEFLKKETELIAKYGENAKRTAETYYDLGATIYTENLPGAITVFKRSVAVYPYDSNLIMTLASLYEKNNEIENAIKVYTDAIAVSKKHDYGNEESFQKEIDKLKNI